MSRHALEPFCDNSVAVTKSTSTHKLVHSCGQSFGNDGCKSELFMNSGLIIATNIKTQLLPELEVELGIQLMN